jgi:hypothetical protein
MTPSLERLNELVRQAEARSRSKKVEADVRLAAERLREAERRAREATRRLREGRPTRLRQLEKADVDEHQLKDLVKKLAQFKSALDPGSDPEGLVDAARGEIERSRREARVALEEMTREADEARRALRAVMDPYQQLRRELDRLLPKAGEAFAAEDHVLWDAETLFPGGWLHGLAREVEAGVPFYGMLSRPEQYAQLKIWIGRYRQFQDEGDPGATPGSVSAVEIEEAQALAQRVFHQLKTLSKQYEPGYIDAFRLDFQTDWSAYVAEAQGQLQQAVDAAKHAREREQQRGEQQARDAERLQQTREAGRAALAALKELTDGGNRPAEELDLAALADLLRKAVRGLGASDPDVLAAAAPYREHVDGDDLRALRLNLDRARREEVGDPEPDVARDEDLLASTRGLRALMVGGSVREDARRSLESLFGFDRLDWEPYEDAKPAALDSLEQRVRNGGVDLVLILKGFIGHHVTDRLRPACQKSGVPCVLVERGYGPSQVGEALRRGLPKSA